jgi:sulfatase-like protein
VAVTVNASLSDRRVARTKVLALVLFFAFAPRAWADDIHASVVMLSHVARYARPSTLYAAVLFVCFLALAVTPFLRNHLARCAFVALFLTMFALDRVVLATSGHHADVTLIRMLWHNRSVAGAVLGEYMPVIAPHVVATLGLGGVLAWPCPRGLPARYALLPVAAILLVSVQYVSWKGALDGYPSPFLVAARAASVLVKPSTHNDLAFRPVALPRDPAAASTFDQIVFVMDESVRGDYLTINNRGIDTTPFLSESADRLVNFGIATAGGNCSVASRWMMRRGVRPWQLPNQPSLDDDIDGIVTGPRTSMWQFAQGAGFRTVYLDPFRPEIGDSHSGLSPRELAFVDEHITLDGPRHLRDRDAAQRLITTLQRRERTFLYVDKIGAHFPYDLDTPPDFNRYARPDGSRFLFDRKTYDDLIGSYKNAIAWNVDGFFREVLSRVDLRRTLLIYTSDHGENLWDGTGTHWRHCDSNPPAIEVWVPLLAATGNEQFGSALRTSASRSFNRAAHVDIFPTLLLAMGYDAAAVTAAYGPSLLNIPAARHLQFVTGDVIGRETRQWFDASATEPGR